MTADQFVTALKAEGATVVEHAGWRTHNRAGHGDWGPVSGVVIHHTAGTDSLSLCYNGRSDLPGPLCHAHIAKNGTVTMVGNGRANHAGTFAANAVSAMKEGSSNHPRPDVAEPVDANAITYGVEVENKGNGKDPYPEAQRTAVVRFAAAICRFHGWTAESVIGHKEGTRRKVDPSFTMDDFRDEVAVQLKKVIGGTTSKPTKTTKPAKPSVSLANLIEAAKKDPKLAQGKTTHKADVKVVEDALKAEGLLKGKYVDGAFGTLTVDAYRDWQKKCGYTGDAANGIPGKASLTKLAKKHGFTVKA
jgi:hypothetical protein